MIGEHDKSPVRELRADWERASASLEVERTTAVRSAIRANLREIGLALVPLLLRELDAVTQERDAWETYGKVAARHATEWREAAERLQQERDFCGATVNNLTFRIDTLIRERDEARRTAGMVGCFTIDGAWVAVAPAISPGPR